MTPRLLEKYRNEVVPAMKAKFGYKSVMSVPKVEKIVINVGMGRIAKDTKMIERIESDLSLITGQKVAPRKAKKSIAGFKLREGMKIGVIATLRRKRMYDFMDKLISVALPRSRDFRGLNPDSVDAGGSLNMGIKENNIFPEVSYESLKDIFGFQITVTTTASTKEEGLELLKLMGFPMRR